MMCIVLLFFPPSIQAVAESCDYGTEIYRPPGTDCDLSSLEVALGSCHLSKYRNIMVLGDFNIDMNDPQSPLQETSCP